MSTTIFLLPIRILIFILRELTLMFRAAQHSCSLIVIACFVVIGYLFLYYGTELLHIAHASLSLLH